MCGISGIFRPRGILERDFANSSLSISELKARGPNNSKSIKVSEKIILNHTRLSIIDPDQKNNQPIYSFSGRFIMVFNGEIYNYKDLKKKLLNSRNQIKYFKEIENVNSDTRILVEYFEEFGVENTLKILNGMYAFALFDRKLNFLHLGRDYYGQKPLYYYHSPDLFAFSSLLKDCLRLSTTKPRINVKTAHHGIQFGMSLLPESLFEGIFEVPPGNLLKCCLHDSYSIIKSHINLKSEIKLNYKNNIQTKNCQSLMISSISNHLIADCEIGLFLSGGVDSSLIAALMAKKLGSKKINAFTLNSPNSQSANLANKVAKSLGIENHKIDIKSNDFLELIEQTFEEIDIPVYDPAFFTARYLYRRANNLGCKVVITGDGADECFGGYSRHYLNYFSNKILPSFISENIRNYIIQINNRFKLPRKINQTLHLFLSNSAAESYLSLLSDNPSIHNQAKCIKTIVQDLFAAMPNPELFCEIDQRLFLPNKMLLKSDRAGMLESVESRSPFLDMNFLALDNPINNLKPKKLLKKELKEYLPDYPIDLKKEGFYSPYNLIFSSLSIDSLIKSRIFLEIDQILELPNFSSNFKEKILNFRNQKFVPNSIWNYLALAKWMQQNIF